MFEWLKIANSNQNKIVLHSTKIDLIDELLATLFELHVIVKLQKFPYINMKFQIKVFERKEVIIINGWCCFEWGVEAVMTRKSTTIYSINTMPGCSHRFIIFKRMIHYINK